jgi:spore germination protein YaaH
MKKKFIYFLIAIILFFPQNIFAMEKLFYVSEKNAEEAVKSLNQNWQKVDIVAPQMYAVGTDLNLYGKLGTKLKKSIADHNFKVMPLVVNTNFNKKVIHNLLVSQNAQDRIIKGLVYLARKNKYIGWQFDFENIDYKDKDLFSAFVKRTYAEFQKNNLLLSVAVVARWSDFEDTVAFKSWSGVYDYKVIAENTDFISYMTYDDPNSVGPVASLDFTKKCLEYVKDKIPAEKLSLGVPFYYWSWNADTKKRIASGPYSKVLATIEKFAHVINFDANLGVSCLSYSYNNKNYKVWFENDKSVAKKLEIVEQNNLRGFSVWQIGGEDPKIWGVLSERVDKNADS